MTRRSFAPHLRTTRLIVLAGLVSLSGCASLSDFACDVHESRTRDLKPVTTYTLLPQPAGRPHAGNAAEVRALPKGTLAQAPTYTLSFSSGFIKPCNTLSINKDVSVQRGEAPDLVFTEVREFYAEDGTLITTSTDDVTDQLRVSGRYTATTPLPIPRNAPAGKYRIVSRLMVERKSEKRSVMLGKAEGYFYIIPRR